MNANWVGVVIINMFPWGVRDGICMRFVLQLEASSPVKLRVGQQF